MGTLRYCRAVHLTSWHSHAFLHTSELSTTCTLKWILLGPLVHWKKKKMPLYSSTRAMNALPWRWSDFTILSHPFVWGSLLPFLLLSLPLSLSHDKQSCCPREPIVRKETRWRTRVFGENAVDGTRCIKHRHCDTLMWCWTLEKISKRWSCFVVSVLSVYTVAYSLVLQRSELIRDFIE